MYPTHSSYRPGGTSAWTSSRSEALSNPVTKPAPEYPAPLLATCTPTRDPDSASKRYVCPRAIGPSRQAASIAIRQVIHHPPSDSVLAAVCDSLAELGFA